MPAFKPDQCHLTCHGRDFHFVSYEGQKANEKRHELELPPMWYLMGPARRWPVMPWVAGQPELELRRDLRAWLVSQGLASAVARPA